MTLHDVKNDVNLCMILRKFLNLDVLLPENGQYMDVYFVLYIKSVFEVPGIGWIVFLHHTMLHDVNLYKILRKSLKSRVFVI